MRVSVYFGGIQSDAFCSVKQRAYVAFIWKVLGLFFSSGSVGCWSSQLRGLFVWWSLLGLIWESGSGHQLIQEGWSCGFHTNVVPCSIPLFQPVDLVPRQERSGVKDWMSPCWSSLMGSTPQSTSSCGSTLAFSWGGDAPCMCPKLME